MISILYTVYAHQSTYNGEQFSPECNDVFTTGGWSLLREVLFQGSLVCEFQDHIVRSIMDKTAMVSNDISMFSRLSQLFKCAHFIVKVLLGVLGPISLQDKGVRLLIIRILLEVSWLGM